MIEMLVAAAVAFGVTVVVTPFAIRFLRARNIGQFIQTEVEGHQHKQGTPTMGGIVMIVAVLIAYLVAKIDLRNEAGAIAPGFRDFEVRGLLILLALVGMGVIGFIDDFSKVRRARNLGLKKRWKFLGQLAIASLFAWGALATDGISTELSFARPLGLELGWFYVVLVLVMLTGVSNGLNLTDGLDGLAAGSSALVFGAYVIISFWKFRNIDFYGSTSLEPAVMAAAITAAALGFLWWNTAPAKVFMGDTGSNALGGALAATALVTDTHLLLVVVGGLYVWETVSVIIQVAAFRGWRRRVFLMAPVHHHYELKGWPETTVIVRFWIISAIAIALGLGLFYADFLAAGGGG
ncbi:MAG: phospho-N-acetylmuramoyl-pentapeptide-transferase [Acidimicrobiia bacterium]|nr:phospho-N-acetylmuramoyl-pentapeptide-transferase [Acidimicrobiia bacterium]